MVHALRQARRVLKTDGLLLDLRPAAIHRSVGIEIDGAYQQVAKMEEVFHGDYAANGAVKTMIEAGLLKLTSRIRFDCTRRMDRFSDFRTWLDEYISLGEVRRPEKLAEKVRKALRSYNGKARIVVLGPVDLRVLVKTVNRE